MGCNVAHQATDPTIKPIRYQIYFEKPEPSIDPLDKSEEIHIQSPVKPQSARSSNPNLPESLRRSNSLTYETVLTEFDRREINHKCHLYPFDCIGVLTFQVQHQIQKHDGQSEINLFEGVGNSFLISKTLVVTAGHNIDLYEQKNGRRLKFLPNKYNTNWMRSNSINVKAYRRVKSDETGFHEDFAILQLEKEVPKSRYIVLGYDYNLKNTQGLLAGFRRLPNTNFQQTWMKGQIPQISSQQIFYDIDTQSGQSGAPLFVEVGHENYLAIGIHVGKDESPYNCACKITASMINIFKGWAKERNIIDEFVAIKMPQLFTQFINNPFKNTASFISTYQQRNIFVREKKQTKQNQFKSKQPQQQLKTIVEEREEETLQNERSSENNSLYKHKQNKNEKNVNNQQLTPQQFIIYASDKNYQQLFQLAKYQYRNQNYHQSLLICEYILKRFSPFQHPKEKIMAENLLALNYLHLHQQNVALGILSRIAIEDIENNKTQEMILIYNNIGSIYFDIGETNKAFKFIKQAYRMYKQCKRQNHTHMISLTYNFGIIQVSKNDYAQAISKIDRAITLHQNLFPNNRKQLSEMYEMLSELHYQRENFHLWMRNAYIGLALLKEFYLDRFKVEQKRQRKKQKQQQKRKNVNFEDKYPHFHQRQINFIEQLLNIAQNRNGFTLELLLEGLMMIRNIVGSNEKKEIKSMFNKAVNIFKNNLLQASVSV